MSMNVLVLLAGVADPRHPLPAPTDAHALLHARISHPVLSPFDEAALEIALKLRDADPTTEISALVVATSEREPLLRTAASFRLAHTLGVDAAGLPLWDAAAAARALADVVRTHFPQPPLVLLGREFGDGDDGTLPAALATALGMPYASLALSLRIEADRASVLRQGAAGLERWRLPLPLVASITNDPQNRLRHPLLKNVMAAKKMPFSLITPPPAVPMLRLASSIAAAPPERTGPCAMLAGPPAAQAAALARLLQKTVSAA